MVISVHQAETLGLSSIHRQGTDAHISAAGDVVIHEGAVVHPVELVAGKDQVVVHIPLLKQPLVFAHRIGGAFKPARALGGLLRSQHLHETLAEAGGEVVALGEVPVEGGAVELRQHVHLVDAGVDAITDRNINQAILAGQRHSGLGAHLGERIEARAGSAAENDRQNALHT